MGAGAARMQPAALWPQLDLLVGDVLAAAARLAQDRHPGASPLPFATSCCALLVAPRAQRCTEVVLQ
jgi:hypothetical protein